MEMALNDMSEKTKSATKDFTCKEATKDAQAAIQRHAKLKQKIFGRGQNTEP